MRLDRAVKRNGWVFPRDDDGMCVIRFIDDTFSVLDVATGRLRFPPVALDPRVLPGEGLNPSYLDAGSVMASPDGRWVLGLGLTEYWVWDARSGELKLQRDQGAFSFCTFSADGTRFVEVSNDQVTIWSLPDARKVLGPLAVTRHVSRPGVYLVPQFSPDGQTLVVVDPWEAIHVFDATTGELRHSWPHRDDWIFPGTIQMLPDGRLFCESAHAYEGWNLATGECQKLPHIGWDNLRACSSDASGARLLWVTPKGEAHVVDTATGRTLTEETALHESGDVVAVLSPDGERIAAGTGRGELRWLRVGRGIARPLQLPAVAAGFTPDAPSRLRVVSRTHSRLIDVRTGRDVVAPAGHPHDLPLRWSEPWLAPGARFLLVPEPDSGWESWDYAVADRPRVIRLDEGSREHFLEFSPEGNFNAFLGRKGREVGVWNMATGRLAGPKISHDDDTLNIWSIRVGAEGRVLTTGFSRGFVAIWETSTGRLLTKLELSSRGTPNLVNLSPDGRRVIVATTLGEAQVFDASSGHATSPVFEVAPGGAFTTGTAGAFFSPDGRWLATVETGGTQVRDGASFAPVGEVIRVKPGGPNSMFFSRDGTRLCVGMELWDVPSGERITDAPEDGRLPGGISLVNLSPDGTYLLNLLFVDSERSCRVRSVPPPARGARVPEWLLQLTTNIAGREIDDAEQSVAVPGSMLQLETVGRELAALPADAPYVEWGRWILDDRADRPIAPGFTITPAEADKLARQD